MGPILPIPVAQCKPHSVAHSNYRYRMGIRQTGAENALALIKHRTGGKLKPNETSGVSRLQKAGVPGATAQRVLGGKENFYVDALEATAIGLGVQPWQLLVPGLAPDAPPALHPS